MFLFGFKSMAFTPIFAFFRKKSVLRKKEMKGYLILLLFLINFSFAFGQDDFATVKLKDVNGEIIDFSDIIALSKDTPVIVSFWATWCIPCLNELDNINDELEERQAVRPFRFFGVSVDDARTAKRVKPFIRGKGWKFDVLMDVNSELKRALNITDVPHVLIFHKGDIAYRHTGYVAGEEENLFQELRKL